MKTLTLLLTLLTGGWFLPAAFSQTASNSVVRFRFSAGADFVREVDVELFDTEKPVTVRNFMNYVLTGRYTNVFLHRCLPGFIVQGGATTAGDALSTNLFTGSNDFGRVSTLAPIVNEFAVGPRRSNVYGTIAMAKVPGNPNSATSEWFLNLGNNGANLDTQNGGFTVFGRVINDAAGALAHFNSLREGQGIVNMAEFDPGASSLVTNLPANLASNIQPAFKDLFFVEILLVRDMDSPRCAVTYPSTAIRVTNGFFTAKGTATDNLAVKEVLFQLNNLGIDVATTTNGGANWTADMLLSPGPNTFVVESVDYAGRHSVSQPRSVFCVVLAPLGLQTNGPGTIFGATNGQRFEVGRSYRLTARPAPGHLFAGWSGGVSETNTTLNFIMQTSLSIQATFVPAPFLAVRGTYTGLYSEAEEVRHETSGLGILTVTERGGYTARLTGGGRVLAMSGQLASDGRATNLVSRLGTNALRVEWFLDGSVQSNQLTATLSPVSGSWTSHLAADRVWFNAVTNPVANRPIQLTWNIPGTVGSSVVPEGDGFVLARINPNGSTTLSGALADGTAFTQSVPISKEGGLPFYVPLYGGRGSIFADVALIDGPTSDVEGLLTWTRPALPPARYYPAGFTNRIELSGSRYTASAPVMNFQEGAVIFSGGNLPVSFTNDVVLGANNKVTNSSPNKLALTISTNIGLFTGSVTVPNTTKVLFFKGVLDQKAQFGSGFFLNTNRGGQVLFQSR